MILYVFCAIIIFRINLAFCRAVLFTRAVPLGLSNLTSSLQEFDVAARLKEIFEYIAPNYNITIEEWNTDKDHVHVLFKGHPNSELSKFINAYKSASSRLIKKEFPFIRKYLWKEMFWSRSFCLLTTGGVTIETIRRYIETQGEK